MTPTLPSNWLPLRFTLRLFDPERIHMVSLYNETMCILSGSNFWPVPFVKTSTTFCLPSLVLRSPFQSDFSRKTVHTLCGRPPFLGTPAQHQDWERIVRKKSQKGEMFGGLLVSRDQTSKTYCCACLSCCEKRSRDFFSRVIFRLFSPGHGYIFSQLFVRDTPPPVSPP